MCVSRWIESRYSRIIQKKCMLTCVCVLLCVFIHVVASMGGGSRRDRRIRSVCLCAGWGSEQGARELAVLTCVGTAMLNTM